MKSKLIPKAPFAGFFSCPCVMVTTGNKKESNIMTLSWVGVVCSSPPLIGIAVRPQRHSYELIRKYKEFVINIPDTSLLKEADICGTIDGKSIDKFAKAGLSKASPVFVKAPLIKECKANFECKAKKRIRLGSHDLFIAEIMLAHIDKSLLNPDGSIDITKIKPFVHCLPDYYSIGEKIGKMGHVCKDKVSYDENKTLRVIEDIQKKGFWIDKNK